MLEWLCTAHHVSSVIEVGLFLAGVSGAAFVAGFIWTFYLALEPYVRRRWPQSMITWSRVLGGEFRDPLVGGYLLAGIALGLGWSLCGLLGSLAVQNYGSYQLENHRVMLNSLMGARQMAGTTLSALIAAVAVGLGFVLLIFLLRVVLRRQWLMAAVFIALSVGLSAVFNGGYLATALLSALTFSLVLVGLLRFGVLPVVVMCFAAQLSSSPLTTDLSAWYSGCAVFPIAIILALTAYSFHTAVAGRPLFKPGFLESD